MPFSMFLKRVPDCNEGFSTKPLQPHGITAPFAALCRVTWAGATYCDTLPPVLMYMLAFVALAGVTNCRSEHAWHRSRDTAEPFEIQHSY
jgi:hypothetical protein